MALRVPEYPRSLAIIVSLSSFMHVRVRIGVLCSIVQITPAPSGASETFSTTPRFQKRGPRAWVKTSKCPNSRARAGGTTRRLVHALADANSNQWIPTVRRFLDVCKASGTDLSHSESTDMALALAQAQHFDWLCHGVKISRRGNRCFLQPTGLKRQTSS